MMEDKKTKVVVAFLCYRDDSDLLLEALRAAKAAFAKSVRLDPVFALLDDAWCPVRADVREKFLQDEKCIRMETTYRRATMLLGGENFTGQVRAFRDVAKMTGAEILVKHDVDTCLFKVDWLEMFADDPKAMCAGGFDYGLNNHMSVFGFCYALKGACLDALLADAEKYPAHHKAWEDHETSSRVYRIYNGEQGVLMRWRANDPGDGFIVQPLERANDTFINARAASCAWDFQTQPPENKPAFRRKVLETMKHWNDLVEQRDLKLKEEVTT